MIHQKRKKIQFMENIMTRDGINYPVYGQTTISMNCVRRFGGSLLPLSKLNGTERVYLDYLTEVMDFENKVFHNEKLRTDFIKYMGSDSETSFKDQTLRKFFKNLTETPFLISSGKRGTYFVNPVYFCKSGTNRDLLIKKLAEEKKLPKNG